MPVSKADAALTPKADYAEDGAENVVSKAQKQPCGQGFADAGPLEKASAAAAPEAEDAAETAAAKAHGRSDDPDDIIDALETAEDKYDKSHPDSDATSGILVA